MSNMKFIRVQKSAARVLILAVLGLGLSLWSQSAPAQDPAGNQTMNILAFGDSLTAGLGLQLNQSFPYLLEQKLRQSGIKARVVNAGVSGDTTADGLNRLEWSLSGQGEDKIDAVILELGANDALRGLDPERTEKNLDKMLGMIRERGLPVLLAGMLAISNYGQGYSERFNSIYPRLAEKHGVLLYPFILEGVAQRPELNQMDGIHPNAEGAAVIAGKMFPLVLELAGRVRGRGRE